MHLIGQVAQVRMVGARGVMGPPLHLHTSKSRYGVLSPFPHCEWHQTRQGVWMPVPEVWGGTGISGAWQFQRAFFGDYQQAASATSTQNLSNTYTFGSAGNTGGGRFRLSAAKTLTAIYFNISAYGGTPANVTDVLVELRNDTSNKPGSTVHATASPNPNSATGWISSGAISFAASAATTYWAVIAKGTSGGATDFATMVLRLTAGVNSLIDFIGDKMAADSTNGWSTTSIRANPASICLTDGTVTIGNPFISTANATSSTNRKGLLISGLTEQLKIMGMISASSSANFSGIELWSGSGGPSGSPDATGTNQFLDGSSIQPGYFFSTPQTLAKSTQYRLVLTCSAAATAPRKQQIGTGANADLRAAMQGGGSWYWTEANATTDWSNDDTNSWPQVAVIIEDQVAISTGGLVTHPGMVGGMRA
jgi:hypothetical protein